VQGLIAVGVRITSLPATAEKVYTAIEGQMRAEVATDYSRLIALRHALPCRCVVLSGHPEGRQRRGRPGAWVTRT
jgi:hypothetical protein